MADAKSNTPFRVSEDASKHLELAAFHLYEAGRDHAPEIPEWSSDAAGHERTDCRFRITAAHRKGILSCILVAIERLAGSFAVADGEKWPDCNRAVSPNLPQVQQLAIAANRRQRYRHLARIAHAEIQNYYELGVDSEDVRQAIIDSARTRFASDKIALAAWRGLSRMPSTVTQIRKDTE